LFSIIANAGSNGGGGLIVAVLVLRRRPSCMVNNYLIWVMV
jgi:hypothetical protein